MNLPPELKVGVNMNQWLSELTQNKVNVTRPSFQTVKVQFYAARANQNRDADASRFFCLQSCPPTRSGTSSIWSSARQCTKSACAATSRQSRAAPRCCRKQIGRAHVGTPVTDVS